MRASSVSFCPIFLPSLQFLFQSSSYVIHITTIYHNSNVIKVAIPIVSRAKIQRYKDCKNRIRKNRERRRSKSSREWTDKFATNIIEYSSISFLRPLHPILIYALVHSRSTVTRYCGELITHARSTGMVYLW